MSNTRYRALGLVAAALLGVAASSTTSLAKVQYGSWQKTNACRPITVKGPLGIGNLTTPQIGKNKVFECKWQRTVTCTAKLDVIAHPILCTKKKETSGYSQNAPRK